MLRARSDPLFISLLSQLHRCQSRAHQPRAPDLGGTLSNARAMGKGGMEGRVRGSDWLRSRSRVLLVVYVFLAFASERGQRTSARRRVHGRRTETSSS